jgi:hypothetical protein
MRTGDNAHVKDGEIGLIMSKRMPHGAFLPSDLGAPFHVGVNLSKMFLLMSKITHQNREGCSAIEP